MSDDSHDDDNEPNALTRSDVRMGLPPNALEFDPTNPAQRQLPLLVQYKYKGSWPDPSMMAAYRQIVPDAPERIIREWEAEAAHRRSLEKIEAQAEVRALEKSSETEAVVARNFRWGIGGAVVVVLMMSVVTLLLAVMGAPYADWLGVGLIVALGVGALGQSTERIIRALRDHPETPPREVDDGDRKDGELPPPRGD